MLLKEERVVAELSLLGITYLSRLNNEHIEEPREGWILLADLVRQPSSRVRTAAIALLLEHPEFSSQIPKAISRLRSKNRITLKLFYTASVILQQIHAKQFQKSQGLNFSWLPDLFSIELGLSKNLPPERALEELGIRHQELTGIVVNWSGTYENVALHLLRRRKLQSEGDRKL